MSVSEAQRHQLYRTLESTLGEEATNTMIELFPPSDWSDVATKDDLEASESRLDAAIDRLDAGLRSRIDSLNVSLNSRINGLKAGVRADIAVLRTEMGAARTQMVTKSDLMDLRQEINRDQRTLVISLVSAMAVITSVALVVANLG